MRLSCTRNFTTGKDRWFAQFDDSAFGDDNSFWGYGDTAEGAMYNLLVTVETALARRIKQNEQVKA